MVVISEESRFTGAFASVTLAESGRQPGAADRQAAILQRLAEDFQRLAVELGHLIEEQPPPCVSG